MPVSTVALQYIMVMMRSLPPPLMTVSLKPPKAALFSGVQNSVGQSRSLLPVDIHSPNSSSEPTIMSSPFPPMASPNP